MYSIYRSVQFSCSVLSLCDPMHCSTPGFPVHHQIPQLAQTCVHWVGDAIQPSHPLSSPSPAFNLSQQQGLFQWVSSSHQVAKVLEFQLQHQAFQWIFRTDSFRIECLTAQGKFQKNCELFATIYKILLECTLSPGKCSKSLRIKILIIISNTAIASIY